MAFNGYFEAPKITLAQGGLFSVAEVIRHTEDDLKWAMGFDQDYVTPDRVKIVPTHVGPQASYTLFGNPFPADNVHGAVFEIVLEESFSGMGANHNTPFDGLEDALDATTQRALEYALWSGSGIDGAQNRENEAAHWLFDSDAEAVGSASGTVREQLAVMEASATTASTGVQPVIHMTRRAASLAGSALQYKNGQILTRLGSPVVAGAGYGMAGDGLIAATGGLTVHLGPIDINSRDLRDNFDPATNTYTVRASRLASVTFDPNIHVKIESV